MKEKEILIFGTGQFAQIIKRYLEEQGKIVAGFTVNKSCIPHPRGGTSLRDNRRNVSAFRI